MGKFIDFTAETAAEEYAMLAGRLEAFAAYVAQEKYSISRNLCAAMLGFALPEEQTEEDEPDDVEINWFDKD